MHDRDPTKGDDCTERGHSCQSLRVGTYLSRLWTTALGGTGPESAQQVSASSFARGWTCNNELQLQHRLSAGGAGGNPAHANGSLDCRCIAEGHPEMDAITKASRDRVCRNCGDADALMQVAPVHCSRFCGWYLRL